MALKNIIVTVSTSDGNPTVPEDIQQLRDAVQAAAPQEMYVTGDLMHDLANLQHSFRSKLDGVDAGKLIVHLRTPHKIRHIPQQDTGKWIWVDDGVAILYGVQDGADPLRTFYIGVHAEQPMPANLG